MAIYMPITPQDSSSISVPQSVGYLCGISFKKSGTNGMFQAFDILAIRQKVLLILQNAKPEKFSEKKNCKRFLAIRPLNGIQIANIKFQGI
jgi:hypothetical protein